MGQPIVHFEIIGQQPEALRRFYGELFGWEFDTTSLVASEVSDPNDYGFVHPASGDGPGIPGGVGGGASYPSSVIFYIGVPNVDEALTKAESLGGTKVMGPSRAPGRDLVVGHFADPQENVVGVAGPA